MVFDYMFYFSSATIAYFDAVSVEDFVSFVFFVEMFI